MDSAAVIMAIQNEVIDGDLLVRFYNLQNGTDLWIEGLTWRLYEYDMINYIRREFGFDLSELGSNFMFDVIDAKDDFIRQTCFIDGVFKTKTRYDSIQYLLNNHSKGFIIAAMALGIDLDKAEDLFIYEGTIVEMLNDQIDDILQSGNIGNLGYYIDRDRYIADNKANYSESGGFVFIA